MSPTPATPPTGRLVGRALALRCPLCGNHPIFHRWFRMDDRCRRCGLRFERIVGHWFGPLALNTVVSFGALLAITLGSFLLSWPEAPPTWIIAAGLATAVGVPLAFFPWSRTLWLALDLRIRPLEPGEAPSLVDGDGAGVPSPRPRRQRPPADTPGNNN